LRKLPKPQPYALCLVQPFLGRVFRSIRPPVFDGNLA
jgi:hypothetical protein